MSEKPGFLEELKQRSVVRVAIMYGVSAFVILQLADVTFPVFELPDWTHRLVIWLLILGFPLALLLAWVFDITPIGIVRTSERDSAELKQLRRSRKFYLVAIALLVFALSLSFVDWRESGQSVSAPLNQSRSVAVLPFANMSPDPDNAYFADGMAEEVLNVLAKIPDLRVAARTASFRYRDSNVDPRQIGVELNVSHILEGSVRRSGDDIRVTVQLIRSDNGFHLWSETYEAPLIDVFSIQDQIATNVAQALKSSLYAETLRSQASVGTSNLKAYEFYLRAQQLQGADWPRTVQYLRQAVTLDPQFVNAWAQLAMAYSTRVGGTIPAAEAFAYVQEAVDAAMAINPDVPEVLEAKGRLERSKRNYAASELAYRRAKELAPNRVTIDLGNLLIALGRVEEAQLELRHSMSVDPVNTADNYINGLVAANDIDNALVEIEQLFALRSLAIDKPRFFTNAAMIYTLAGQYDRSVALVDELLSHIPPQAFLMRGRMAYAYARAGKVEQAQAIIDDLQRMEEGGYVSPSGYFWAYLGLGQLDQAFEWLNRAIEQNSFLIIMTMKTHPALAPMRSDPRFEEALAKAGLPL